MTMFPSDVTRPVPTLPVSPDPPEILEAQPSQIDEVFVKISPAEDKPKVRQARQGGKISKVRSLFIAGHCHCQQIQKSDLRSEILFKIKELFVNQIELSLVVILSSDPCILDPLSPGDT